MSARLHALTCLALGACALFVATPAPAQDVPADRQAWVDACKDWDDWDKPGPPFRILGNTYYVGTCGISSILIVGSQGMVLIDSGTEAGAEVILANIRSLGFDPAKVELLLTSHEHYDHVGGMARLVEATGAGLITSAEASSVLATGKADPRDPQFGMHEPMAPVKVESTIGERSRIGVGDIVVHPVPTPGHTPGAMSWQWQSCENGQCFHIVYADSLSPVSSDSYRFIDHPEYVEAYRAGIARLSALDCDVLLTPHPSASGLRDRLGATAPLVDREGCRNYAADIEVRLDERLFKEAGPE